MSIRLGVSANHYSINARGQVAWDTQGTIFFWDGDRVHQLAASGVNYPELALNDAGQVVWQSSDGTTAGSDITLWDGTSAHVISHTLEDEDPGVYSKHGLRLSPNGHVTWAGDLLYGSAEIFLYTPPGPGSLELELPSVLGGRSVEARVTLPAPAPAGGVLVRLSSANPAAAAVPPGLTVPEGSRTATFPVTTFPVRPSTTVMLTASAADQNWSAALAVQQAGIDLTGGITRFTSGHGRDSFPRLNDAGQVVWLNWPAAAARRIALWTGPPIPTIRLVAADPTGVPFSVDNRGEVLWEGGSPPDNTIYLWDGESSVPFARTGILGGAGQINDRGQIVWQSWDLGNPAQQPRSTLWFWDGQFRRVLAQNASSPSLNNKGHVVWGTWDGNAIEDQFWDGITIRPFNITSGPSRPFQLNDRDQVLVGEGGPLGGFLALWDGMTERRLTDQASEARLNNHGWVVWQTEGKIYLWNGVSVQSINPTVGFPGSGVQLNDAGEVAWVGGMPPLTQIFLWHAGVTRTLTQDDLSKTEMQLNNAGQVVWTGGDLENSHIYLYTPPLSLAVDPAPLVGGHPVTGTITLAAPAPAGETAVQLASQSPAVTVPAGVTVPPGQTSVTFPITVEPVTAPTRVILTAATPDSFVPAVLSLLPEGLSLQPDRVLGGSAATGTIALPQPAPAGGTSIQLTTDGPAAGVPAAVTVPAGEVAATFPITTTPVSAATTVQLTTALAGRSWTAMLRILAPPVYSIAADPALLSGGTAATGTVTLTSPAPPGAGSVVTLVSSDPALVTIPSTVTVPAGSTQTTFPIRTAPVDRETVVTISASSGDETVSATIRLIPVRLLSIAVKPDQVVAPGNPQPQLIFTLSGPAPDGGADVQLSTDRPDLVFLPDRYYWPSGATASTLLSVGGVSAPTDAVITARFAGVSASTVVHLLPPSVDRLELRPDQVVGGQTVQATVFLNGLAPAQGTVVRLSSDHPEIASVPAQVTIPNSYGAIASFTVKTWLPPRDTVVRITAAAPGGSRSVDLTVFAVYVSGLSIGPRTVLGGTPATGKVTLSGPAPAGGASVRLLSDHGAGASLPDNVLVPAGASEATFSIQTQPVEFPTHLTVDAEYGGSTVEAALQVVPLGLAALTLQPSGVTGGQTVTATVTFNFPAGADGATVELTSDQPQAAAVPATATVPPGAATARFLISTEPVAADGRVVVTARLGRSMVQAVLTIAAPRPAALSLEPDVVQAGGFMAGRITLSGAAPSAGVDVSLVSSDPKTAVVPDLVQVPPGAKEAVFAVTTRAMTSPVELSITAISADAVRTAAFLVVPPPATRGVGETPATFSVSVLPAQVIGGTQLRGVISLAGPAPPGGRLFTLSADPASGIKLPGQVVVPAGMSAVAFPIGTRTVGSATGVTISATAGDEIETTALRLLP